MTYIVFIRFATSKYTKQSKLKAILETSTFRISKFDIFISNGSFGNFYSNLPKTLFILKMSKKKAQTWNEHLFNTRNGNFQVKNIILCFLANFAQNFLCTQNDQTKRTTRWKFSSQTVWIFLFKNPKVVKRKNGRIILIKHLIKRLIINASLKNQNWAYPWINSLKF